MFFLMNMLTGCTTVGSPQQIKLPETTAVNRYDLQGSINGVPFEGIGVIPRSPSYRIRIQSRQDVDLLISTSCHREVPAWSVIKKGWFEDRRGYEFTYEPAPGIEDEGSCLMRLGTYNGSVQGVNAHAIIDFGTTAEQLSARNICNGASGRTGGVSMCQSKAGLVQRLEFDGPTRSVTPPKGTEPLFHGEKVCTGKWLSQRLFEYEIQAGECVVAFMEEAQPHRIHRHTVVGYTTIPVTIGVQR
jgi:hypothetical protein